MDSEQIDWRKVRNIYDLYFANEISADDALLQLEALINGSEEN